MGYLVKAYVVFELKKLILPSNTYGERRTESMSASIKTRSSCPKVINIHSHFVSNIFKITKQIKCESLINTFFSSGLFSLKKWVNASYTPFFYKNTLIFAESQYS